MAGEQARATVRITAEQDGALDQAINETEQKLGRLGNGKGGGADGGLGGIRTAFSEIRKLMSFIVWPTAIATGIVGSINRLVALRSEAEATKRTFEEMGQSLGNALDEATQPERNDPAARLLDAQRRAGDAKNKLVEEAQKQKLELAKRSTFGNILALLGYGQSEEDIDRALDEAISKIEIKQRVASQRVQKQNEQIRKDDDTGRADALARGAAALANTEEERIAIEFAQRKAELVRQIEKEEATTGFEEKLKFLRTRLQQETDLELKELRKLNDEKRRQNRELLEDLKRAQTAAFGPTSNLSGVGSGTALQMITLGLSSALRNQGGR